MGKKNKQTTKRKIMSGEVNQIALCHAWHKKAMIRTDA